MNFSRIQFSWLTATLGKSMSILQCMYPQNLSSKIFRDHLTMKLDPLKLFCYTVCAVHACVNCTYRNTGVEKNDDSKWHYFSSNKHDAPGEIIKSEYRQETLQRGAWGHPA